MSDNEIDNLTNWDRLAEFLSDVCATASDEEAVQALKVDGTTVEAASLHISAIAEHAINAVLIQRLQEARVAARTPFVIASTDTTDRDVLLNELRLLVANEGDRGELLTLAARSGRNGLSVADLKSLVEDLRWVKDRNRDGK